MKITKENFKRIGKASGKIVVNLGIVVIGSVITAVFAGKSKTAAAEIGDGFKQMYNVGRNIYHQYKENRQ
jgi:hypothetical protein